MDGPVPDVLVFFTDGYGEFPEEEPCIPVCWIMPDGDCREVPFGQVIPMDVHG
jgi:predicted metal-dependent peptidase